MYNVCFCCIKLTTFKPCFLEHYQFHLGCYYMISLKYIKKILHIKGWNYQKYWWTVLHQWERRSSSSSPASLAADLFGIGRKANWSLQALSYVVHSSRGEFQITNVLMTIMRSQNHNLTMANLNLTHRASLLRFSGRRDTSWVVLSQTPRAVGFKRLKKSNAFVKWFTAFEKCSGPTPNECLLI